MKRLWRGLTESAAETDPRAEDRRLRGRTYAIPFDRVWRCALELADGAMRRCSVLSADDEAGIIEAEYPSLVLRRMDDLRIEIGLDENGQTRVDVRSACRDGKADLGRNPRTIGRFLKRLDRRLEADPAQILDPTRPPAWSE